MKISHRMKRVRVKRDLEVAIFFRLVGTDCHLREIAKTDYPAALMEKAVSTGREAANLCLFLDDVREVELTVTDSKVPGLI